MPPKTKPLPLHVSLHRIQEEKKNLERRTKVRLAALLAEQNQEDYNETKYPAHVVQNERQILDWHNCLNMFCFGLCLLILNFLFLQWLYIKVNFKEL